MPGPISTESVYFMTLSADSDASCEDCSVPTDDLSNMRVSSVCSFESTSHRVPHRSPSDIYLPLIYYGDLEYTKAGTALGAGSLLILMKSVRTHFSSLTQMIYKG